MVYRGSLQTDDPRDAPRLVRMSPLRSSRPVPDSRAVPSVNSPAVYHGPFVPAIDVHRAKLIDERRLPRCEGDYEDGRAQGRGAKAAEHQSDTGHGVRRSGAHTYGEDRPDGEGSAENNRDRRRDR